MDLVKKLVFAPLFLLALVCTLYLLGPIFRLTDLVFGLNFDILKQIVILCASIIVLSLTYVIFVTLSQDFRLILPIILAAAVFPVILVSPPLSYVLTLGLVLVFVLQTTLFLNKLKSYLTFSASTLLGPAVKSLTTMIILIISLTYYLSMSAVVSKNGFQIPDSVLDFAIKFATPNMEQLPNVKGVQYVAQLPKLTPDQIQLLKQNPDALKQYGIDPKILDQLGNPNALKSKPQDLVKEMPLSGDILKNLIKNQLQSAIKPFEKSIPGILAALLFFILQPIASLLSISVSPLLWLLFYIFEKTGFVKFEKEMREVKKMVV